LKHWTYILLLIYFLSSCSKPASVFQNTGNIDEDGMPDLEQIEESGELIAVTLSGKETYYEYKGRSLGVHFAMAEMFANQLGLRLRIEVASDTIEMLEMVKSAKADLIACELPDNLIIDNGLTKGGAWGDSGSWAIRQSSVLLKEKLDEWYSPSCREDALLDVQNTMTNKYKIHRVFASFSNKGKGIVSNYDMLFAEASRQTGWDWKLIASQCYQESGFDPNAVSWAGARGLMQIMPSTGKRYGVSPDELFDPQTNMATAVQVINNLERQFGNITNPTERKKFVLAAYNCGYGHVSDAQALARKYKRNAMLWDDVSYFVLHLSEPTYYNDAVVKHGRMNGNETFNYVNRVMGRWNGYHAVLQGAAPKGEGRYDLSKIPHKKNRFSKQQDIVGKDDSVFVIKR